MISNIIFSSLDEIDEKLLNRSFYLDRIIRREKTINSKTIFFYLIWYSNIISLIFSKVIYNLLNLNNYFLDSFFFIMLLVFLLLFSILVFKFDVLLLPRKLHLFRKYYKILTKHEGALLPFKINYLSRLYFYIISVLYTLIFFILEKNIVILSKRHLISFSVICIYILAIVIIITLFFDKYYQDIKLNNVNPDDFDIDTKETIVYHGKDVVIYLVDDYIHVVSNNGDEYYKLETKSIDYNFDLMILKMIKIINE